MYAYVPRLRRPEVRCWSLLFLALGSGRVIDNNGELHGTVTLGSPQLWPTPITRYPPVDSI